jgi:tetratricopeptide (TPR) repeat protein
LKYKISYTPIVILLLLSNSFCSAQGNDQGKFKRAWHNLLAQYNTYYHAELLLFDGLSKLEEAHKDDFTKVIPVFPDGDESNSKAITAGMDEIMMKTSKLIQGHPTSKWVDDSYLLIAESYFYKYDLYAALEGFQYVFSQYNNTELKYDAQLWILRTFIRQGKYYDAESILGLINQEKKLPRRLNKMLYQSAAELYIKQKKYKQALEMMQKSLPLLRTRTEKYRANFILGQLYYNLNNYRASYNHFEKTVKMYPPYEYAFQANLGMSRLQSKLGGNSAKNTRKYLKRMLRDDKNIDYFDEIYYELGNLELKDGKTADAILYYKQSAWASQKNKIQKANSYLALANLYFERKNYVLAQSYFDSTATFITADHPNYDQIIARQNVLSDLINSLVIIESNDSLLRLAKLDKGDLDKYIDRIIQKEKEAAEIKKNTPEPIIPNPFNNNQLPGGPGGGQNNLPSGGAGMEWYFYNPSAMARGYTEFNRRWGSRKLTDYWRIATKAKEFEADKAFENQTVKNEVVDEVSYNSANDQKQQEAIKDVAQDKQKYYSNIPFSDQAKAVSNVRIEKSLFKAGKVYQESLKEYKIAIGFYDKLLVRYPETNLGAEAVFNLIKCHDALGNKDEVKRYSELLNSKYPKSAFNMVINNADVTENKGENKQIVESFNEMYNAYHAGKFVEAKKIKLETDKHFAGNSLQAKFDLLYAMCIAKTDSLSKYLDLLRIIKESYPGTAVANTAIDYLDYFENKDKKIPEKIEEIGSYVYSPNSEHFYVLTFQGGNTEKIKRAFSDYNAEYFKTKNLQIVSSLLGDMQMIIVKSFPNKVEAEKYYVEFIKNGSFFEKLEIKKYDNLYISDSNFKVLLNEKKQNSYFEFFTRYYIE